MAGMRKFTLLILTAAAFTPALAAPAPAPASTQKICLAFIDGLGCITPCTVYGSVANRVPALSKLPPLECVQVSDA